MSIPSFVKTLLFFCFCIFVLLSNSCITVPHKTPPPSLVTAQQELTSVKTLWKKQKISSDTAFLELQRIVQKYPDSKEALESLYIQGNIYLKREDFLNALRVFRRIIFSPYRNIHVAHATMNIVYIYQKLKDSESLIKFIQQALPELRGEPIVAAGLYKTLVSLQYRNKSYQDVLFTWSDGYRAYPREPWFHEFKKNVVWVVNNQLPIPVLESFVLSAKIHGSIKPYIWFQLGKFYLQQNQINRAEVALSRVVSNDDTDPALKQEVEKVIIEIEKRFLVARNTIGLIVPLSGKYKVVGESIVEGFLLGLGMLNRQLRNTVFQVVIEDSESSAQGAQKAFHELVTKDHVLAIVGAPLTKTAIVLAEKADSLGIPLISFSQKDSLTENKPFVFQNSLTKKIVAEFLINSSILDDGVQASAAILYPSDVYGVSYANTYWNSLLDKGHKVTGVEVYPPEEKDFNDVIQRLVGTFFLSDREKEYREQLKIWLEKNKKYRRRSVPSKLLPPVVQFKTLFIPDTIKTLVQVANMLEYHRIKGVTLVGTYLWNSPKKARQLSYYQSPIVFVDSALTTEEKKSSQFFKKFQRVFNKPPNLFASYAYDSGVFLKEILTSYTIRSRGQLQKKMMSVKDILGAYSTLTLNDQREFSKKLALFSINRGKIVPYTDKVPEP